MPRRRASSNVLRRRVVAVSLRALQPRLHAGWLDDGVRCPYQREPVARKPGRTTRKHASARDAKSHMTHDRTSTAVCRRFSDAGVSIWLDTLSRELLDSGAFATLIADCSVTGATSNPTIFAKAITGSDRYDDQLRAAVASGHSRPAGAVLRARARRRPPGRRPAAPRLRGERTGATASSRSSARPTSPTTPRRRSSRRSSCGTGSRGRT